MTEALAQKAFGKNHSKWMPETAAETSVAEASASVADTRTKVGDAQVTLDSLRATQARVEEALANSKAASSASDELDAKWKHFKGLMDQINNAMIEKMKGYMGGAASRPERPGVVVPLETIAQVVHRSKKVVLLTGAGVSAESGIPTFRGSDGFWTIGSENYRPQEMATFKMFNEHPVELWKWYHQRWGICRKAKPNAGHYAIAELEALCRSKSGGAFHLITQNIDGLHLDAGSSPATTFQVHGSMKLMRCDESQSGSCASDQSLLKRSLDFLLNEYKSLDAAFDRLAEGGERLTETQLARGLHANVFPTQGTVDARENEAGLAEIFAAVRAKGVLEGSEEPYATRASFRALEAAGSAVFPWGEEWSAERIAEDPVPRCPRCNCRCRPEVLWFDECYNEAHFRSTSATEAAADADCLLIVGTTLTTGLPSSIVRTAKKRGIPILNIDPDCLAEPRGDMLNLPRKSGSALPELVTALKALAAEPVAQPSGAPPLRSPEPAAKQPRAAAPVARVREAAKSRRPNPVALPGALGSRARSSSVVKAGASTPPRTATPEPATPEPSTRASTPEERVFLCGADAPWEDGAPALLRGASLYVDNGSPALVLEKTAMAVRGVLTTADAAPKGKKVERSLVVVDVLDPADPSAAPRGQERAWAYHSPLKQVDRTKAAVVPDGDARSYRPAETE